MDFASFMRLISTIYQAKGYYTIVLWKCKGKAVKAIIGHLEGAHGSIGLPRPFTARLEEGFSCEF